MALTLADFEKASEQGGPAAVNALLDELEGDTDAHLDHLEATIEAREVELGLVVVES